MEIVDKILRDGFRKQESIPRTCLTETTSNSFIYSTACIKLIIPILHFSLP